MRLFVSLVAAAMVVGCSGGQPDASINATGLVPSVAPTIPPPSQLPSATGFGPSAPPGGSLGPLPVDRLPRAGLIVFTSAANRVSTVVTTTPDGLDVTELLVGSQAEWSPDGEMLAFSCVTQPNADWLGTCVSRADGSGKTTLIRDGYGPQYSPDGLRIVFERGVIDAHDVFVADARAPGDGQFVGRGAALTWSPDSERLLLYGDLGSNAVGLTIVSRAGDLVQAFGGYAGAWSPDGGKVAFFRVDGTVAQLLLADVIRGGITPTGFATESAPESTVWLAPDRLLLLMDGDIWRLDLARPTEPLQLTTGLAIDWPTLSLSPDRRWVAFTKTSGQNAGLYVASVDGGWALIVAAAELRYPAWQPAP